MHSRTLASAAIWLALAAGPVWAQTDGQTILQAARAAEVRQADAWLASVQTQLELTETQQTAFATYAEAIRAQAQLKAEHRNAGLFVDTARLPPAPEALQRRLVQLRERAAALSTVQAAAAALYADLTPQQRTAFDFLAVTGMGVGSLEMG